MPQISSMVDIISFSKEDGIFTIKYVTVEGEEKTFSGAMLEKDAILTVADDHEHLELYFVRYEDVTPPHVLKTF